MNTMYKRLLGKTLKDCGKSVLLLGPRQTGKTTLIHSLKPDLEFNLSDEQVFLEFSGDPGMLKSVIERKNPKTVFIDEIQRLPGLTNTIQFLVDRDKSLRFILTGSSARKLRRGKANLLPGRIFLFELGPICPAEFGYKLPDRILTHGSLPEVCRLEPETAQKLLSSYAATYLSEEIKAEALTKNIEGFSRFLRVAAAHFGEAVDLTKIGSMSSLQRVSTGRFYEVLEDTMLVHRCESFSKSGPKRLSQHPKFYFFDNGVLNGLLGSYSASEDRKGRLFENLVCSQILASAKARDQTIRLTTYRTGGGAEVDFILEMNDEIIAIEAKASGNVSSKDLRGFHSFKEYLGKRRHKNYVFTLRARNRIVNEVPVLDWQTGLREIGL